MPKKFPEEQKKRRLQEEAALSVQDQIKNLEDKMAKAVKVENYEVAGVLKLKIQELREQLMWFDPFFHFAWVNNPESLKESLTGEFGIFRWCCIGLHQVDVVRIVF